jgi:hypothetical protein
MRKWYFGDMYDNFGVLDSATEAGAAADKLVADGFEGVYVLYLTEEEFKAFCTLGLHTVGKK